MKQNECKKIEDSVRSCVRNYYAEFGLDDESLKGNALVLEVAKEFDSLEEIYEHQERYCLHWAFNNAQLRFDDLFHKILENKIKIHSNHKSLTPEEKSEVSREVKLLLTSNEYRLKRTKRRSQFFNYLLQMVTTIDVLLSLFLVVVISKFGHMGEGLFESAMLSLLVLVLTGLFKVTLEKFFLMPVIEKFGWNLYGQALNHFKDSIASLVSISIAEEKAIHDENCPKKIVDIMRIGIERIG